MQKTKNNILFSQFISIIYYAAKTAVQKTHSDYNKNNYYVFLVKKSEKGEKNGIMPFNRHFGFIFMENSQQLKANSQKLYHTIAHELGHGAFTLYHTFSTKGKGITKGGTYNLMDYTTKQPDNLLRKYQWYVIHNPRLSLFGGDEEEVSSDEEAKYILTIYSATMSEELLTLKAGESMLDKLKEILKMQHTKAGRDWIERNKITDKKSPQYFEMPKDLTVAKYTVNPKGKGIVLYVVEKEPKNSSNYKYVMNRYESGTVTDLSKKKIAQLDNISYNFSETTTPLGLMIDFAKYMEIIVKVGMSLEVKSGGLFSPSGAGTVGFTIAVDKYGNIAFIGTYAAFINQLFKTESFEDLGNSSNWYIGADIGFSMDIGYNKFSDKSNHVKDLLGPMQESDVDISWLDVNFDNLDIMNLSLEGITVSGGVGFSLGVGEMQNNTNLMVVMQLKDMEQFFAEIHKTTALYNYLNNQKAAPTINFDIINNGEEYKFVASVYKILNGKTEVVKKYTLFKLNKISKTGNIIYLETDNVKQ